MAPPTPPTPQAGQNKAGEYSEINARGGDPGVGPGSGGRKRGGSGSGVAGSSRGGSTHAQGSQARLVLENADPTFMSREQARAVGAVPHGPGQHPGGPLHQQGRLSAGSHTLSWLAGKELRALYPLFAMVGLGVGLALWTAERELVSNPSVYLRKRRRTHYGDEELEGLPLTPASNVVTAITTSTGKGSSSEAARHKVATAVSAGSNVVVGVVGEWGKERAEGRPEEVKGEALESHWQQYFGGSIFRWMAAQDVGVIGAIKNVFSDVPHTLPGDNPESTRRAYDTKKRAEAQA